MGLDFGPKSASQKFKPKYTTQIVFVKPSQIRYTLPSIHTRFQDSRSIFNTLHDLEEGTCKVSDIPAIEIIKKDVDFEQHEEM